jgi:hypothetical protein
MNAKIITLALCLSAYIATAQKQNVSIFKNGTAFYVKTQTVNAEKGMITLKEVPQATFGTLWFNAPANSIKSVQSNEEEVENKNKVGSMISLLKANLGKRAIVKLEDNKIYQGSIEAVESEYITLKTIDGKWLVTQPKEIESMELLDMPSYYLKEKKSVINLSFAQNKPSQTLQMMYLQKGISWVPSYVIDLQDDKKARIVLRSTLMNDAEDMDNASVNFVVGVPNFAYTYLESPLTFKQDVMSFINTLNATSNRYGVYYNQPGAVGRGDITTQSMTNMMTREVDQDEEPMEVQNLEGQNAGDLYFYNAQNVTLKKGERAFYDIFQEDVEYQHIYEVNLTGNNSNDYVTISNDLNNVWHSIRLKNTTKYPWTTGTVLITQKVEGVDKPLSQDKLSYVPAGGKGEIKLTIAPNISVKDSEKEISREANKKKKGGYNYDLVTVEGKIELKNYKEENVKLNINRFVQGEMLTCDMAWVINKKVSLYEGFNYNNDVEWEVELAAGKSKEITYQYKIYVRKTY